MFLACLVAATLIPGAQHPQKAHEGELFITGRDGSVVGLCPLKNTSVRATISGFGARVHVIQSFTNPTDAPIEAVYTFPLPDNGAVDSMRIQVGDRIIEGVIKRREDARRIYDEAKANGQTAALLDQERSNIFTQSIANIMPHAKIEVDISYAEILKYEDGQFEFAFPMTVGPRYLGHVKDPAKISPPITPEGTRTGANIQLSVNLDAGAPIQGVESVLHKVNLDHVDASHLKVVLADSNEIPNRDFIFRYRVATDSVRSAFVSHLDSNKGGFFTLALIPPKLPASDQIAPREIYFVIDQSGSQAGFPIEKSKQLTLKLIKTMRVGDTFNVLGFSNDVTYLWRSAKPATPENMAQATKFIEPLQGNGGTELIKAVYAAFGNQNDPRRLRIVLFNSDGFVANENEILDTIQKERASARMFTFGIGNSVNRMLIDAMSVEGQGDAEYVTLAEDGDAAVQRFQQRLQTPVLTKINVQTEGCGASDILPQQIPDVFDGKPIVIYGRYTTPGPGKIRLSGRLGGNPWSETVDVNFGAGSDAPAVESLWARNKVQELVRSSWRREYRGEGVNPQIERITQTALDFNIMSDHTSFVAVEPRVVNIGGKSRTVRVPVEMADGVTYDGAIGHLYDLSDRPTTTLGLQLNVPVGGMSSQSGGYGGGRGASNGNQHLHKVRIIHAGAANMSVVTSAPEQKISVQLRMAKGTIEVQVLVKSITPELLAKLEKAGLKVEGKDLTLGVVFGTCDAKVLAALAKIESVQRIEPLE